MTMPNRPPVAIIVMGVQGIGKTTTGRMLASRLGVPFIDGDSLHPARNVALMAAGTPLDDDDRKPWLRLVGDTIAQHADSSGVVVACSALKRAYRDTLREHAPSLYIVEPWGPIQLIAARIAARSHEYMPPTLLQSQYDTLEPLEADALGIRVSVEQSPEDVVEEILTDYLARVREAA